MLGRFARRECVGRTSTILMGARMCSSMGMLRNLAIIAHVDHGKTTLVDKMLSQAGIATHGDRVMDSNALEIERGITIMSKVTRISMPEGHILNVVDTPGHADFGGEVERILSMVDGVVLLVDAAEGPKPQTKFVLGKALQFKLKPIVVINKVDKDSSRLNGDVENEIFELFVNLDANDEQLEYPVLYCSAKNGWAVTDYSKDHAAPNKTLKPLYDAIVSHIPSPSGNPEAPFRMLVTSIDRDDYLGSIVTGKIQDGSLKMDDSIKAITRTGEALTSGKISSITVRSGLVKEPLTEAVCGDIVSVTGVTAGVTDTICAPDNTVPIEVTAMDPPTIGWIFSVNTSPLVGKEGKLITSSQIANRLQKEIENNVTISLKDGGMSETIEVQGRGELQLGILLETMRREGFEVSVSPPQILYKTDENGKKTEPIEEVTVDVDSDFANMVLERMNRRGGDLIEFSDQPGNKNRIVFSIPSRFLLGFRSEMQIDTRGRAVVFSLFKDYAPFDTRAAPNTRKGVIVSGFSGKTTAYSLDTIEKKAALFVSPGEEVYDGMVIGESYQLDDDMEMNPTKAKKLTNMRAAGKDDNIKLTPPRVLSIERALTYMNPDEIVEITPKSIRLRKRELNSALRKDVMKKANQARRAAKEKIKNQ